MRERGKREGNRTIIVEGWKREQERNREKKKEERPREKRREILAQ